LLNLLYRILTALVGTLGILLAIRMWIDPSQLGAQLGLVVENAKGLATIRADIAGFFGVAGLLTLAAALRQNQKLLLAPALLIAMALLGRVFSLISGDLSTEAIAPMAIELGLLVLFYLAGNHWRSHPPLGHKRATGDRISPADEKPRPMQMILQPRDGSGAADRSAELGLSHMRTDQLVRLARDMFDAPMIWIDVLERPEGTAAPTLIATNDAKTDALFARHALVEGPPYIRFYVCQPIRHLSDQRYLVLCMADTIPRSFDSNLISKLSDLAKVAPGDLQSDKYTMIDLKTGLPNRHGAIWFGNLLLPLSARLSFPVVMMAVSFVQSPDHDAGDNSLQTMVEIDQLVQLLTATFRDADMIARLNEGCFGVLLANCTPIRSLGAATRLGDAVSAHNLAHADKRAIHFHLEVIDFDTKRHGSMTSLIEEAEAKLVSINEQRIETSVTKDDGWPATG
jgi:GGDEF domain-containing protein